MNRLTNTIAISFALGSWLGFVFTWNTLLLFVFLAISCAVFFLSKDHRILNLPVFIAGVLLMSTAINSSQITQYDGSYVKGEGVVIDRWKSTDFYDRLLVELDGIQGQDIRETVLLQVQRGGEEPLVIGQHVSFTGLLQMPSPQGNPGLFDYQRYLLTYGVHATIRTTTEDLSDIYDSGSLSLGIRRVGQDYIRSVFEEHLSPSGADFLNTVLLGKSELPEEVTESFRRLGISHILAVSGLHIGLIALLLLRILGLFGLSRKWIYAITMISLMAYIHILAYKGSAMRAGLMLGISMLSQILHRGYDPKKALGISVLLILITNPLRLFDIGLQLSVLAMIAILYMEPRFSFIDVSGLKLSSMVKLTLVIQIFLLPVQLIYFSELAPLVLLANPILVPLFTIALYGGVLILLTGFLGGMVVGIIDGAVDFVIQGIYQLTQLLGASTQGFYLPSPRPEEFIVYYMLLGLYLNRHRLRHIPSLAKEHFWRLALFYLLVIGASKLYFDPISIQMIDIGQGDAALLSSPGRTVLIDTGGSHLESDRSFETILRPFLRQQVFGPVDYLILSHNDIDHAGNGELLIEEGLVRHVVVSDPAFAVGEIPGASYVKVGDYLPFGEGGLEVLSTGPRGMGPGNDASLVLRLSHYQSSLLFTGDIEREGERALAQRSIQSTLLKVPHHGSKGSGSEEFIRWVQPELALVSVGRKNPYGHPHEEVLQRYEDLGIPLLCTDRDGQLQIEFNRWGAWVEPSIKPRQSILDYLMDNGIMLLLLLASVYLAYRITQYSLSTSNTLERRL
ncbi:MAG: DNA internalization-related competence protein ComEC/Rec2 [Tissierellia bacterium]|nr:DNA internalization-related competence protein ComEC/Rec2 [Tissierellia bacterium]